MKFIQTIIIFIFSLLFLFIPSKVLAAEVIRSFDVNITAHKDDTFDVKENIVYDFGNEEHHGIFRDIPLVSKVGDLYRIIEINFKEILRDGVNENYSQSIDNSKTSVKIGSANTTISGEHTYTISYLVKNGVGSNYEDHDEIYWNITGNEWNVPILKASARLTTDFDIKADKAICYTGVQGSTNESCDFSQVNYIYTTQALNSGEGLSGVWNFPKNTFPPSVLQIKNPVSDSNIDPFIVKIILFSLLAVSISFNFIVAPILLIWYFKNKRKQRFGPPTVNFNIPKDNKERRITPAEAGSIDTYWVDQNDVVATIFDLAIRKYLKIEQVKKNKALGVFGDNEDYVFTKLKKIDEGTQVFEFALLKRLFYDGDTVKLSSLKKDFHETFQTVERDIFKLLALKGFYTKNPKNQMTLLLVIGILVIFMSGIILGPVLIYLSRVLNGRTALGDETDWKIDGLKIFLKNMKREYSWNAKNLHVIEEMIPYAIAFGFINEFMDQFKIIYPKYKSTWYSGNLAFYMATNSMINSMNSSFTTHASSSSSGFSGGFSGGGGGGGGGGSW